MTDDSGKSKNVSIILFEMEAIHVAIGFGIPLSFILTLRKLFKKHCISCRLSEKVENGAN